MKLKLQALLITVYSFVFFFIEIIFKLKKNKKLLLASSYLVYSLLIAVKKLCALGCGLAVDYIHMFIFVLLIASM